MNQRIQELAKQVGMEPEEETEGIIWWLSNSDLEKFAELIVRECFDVVINDGRFHDAKGIIRAGKSVAMEHFGVES